MINPQDGAVLRYVATDLGQAPAPGGATARRWRLPGENALEIWCDSAGLWTGLRARAFDGSQIEHRPGT
jgi:hypothetical protein